MEKIIDELVGHGLVVDSLIIDGKIHRVNSNFSKKKNNKAGWYQAREHNSNVYVNYGCWIRGTSERFPGGNGSATKIDIECWKLIKEREAVSREKEQRAALARINNFLKSCSNENVKHEYLIKKQIKQSGALVNGNRIVLPLTNEHGEITTYQTIDQHGNKLFASGGKVKGSCFAIQGNDSYVCICEGFATGASIYEATGFKVIVAFNAGNILPVSEKVLKKYPNSNIIICADNDHKGKINTGVEKGKSVSEKLDLFCVWPTGIEGTDFNDMFCEIGIDAVRETIIRGKPVEIYDNSEKKSNTDDIILKLTKNAPVVLRDIVDYYNKTAIKPQPIFALATGLSFISVVLGRKYVTQFDNYSSCYFLLIAKSGTGKDHPKTVIRKLLTSCNLAWLERAGGYTSSNTVMKSLEKQPLQISFFEEIGQRLKEAARNNRSLASGVFRQLLDVWSSCHSSSVGEEYADGTTPRVKNPALTIVGITTPKEFFGSVSESLIEQGFINRLLPFISRADRKAVDLCNTTHDECDTARIKQWALSHWHEVNNDLGQIVEPDGAMRSAPHNNETVVVKFDDESIIFLNDVEKKVVALAEKIETVGLDDVPTRIREITMRIALAIAVVDRSDEIRLRHVEWSFELVWNMYESYIKGIRQNMFGSDFEKAKMEALSDLRSRGKVGIKPADMPKKRPWSKFEKKLRSEVLNELEDSGLAEKIKVRTGKRGPGTTIWIALK